MEASFWRHRWEQRQIGFHQAETNLFLKKFGQKLGDAGCVFVPLCGKSLDMVYLASLGHKIVGVELVETAVEEFFVEQQLQPSKTRLENGLVRYESGSYTLYAGDVFALSPQALGNITAVYDRGSLVALPPKMRAEFAAVLLSYMPQGCRMLAVLFSYAEGLREGPPFSVPQRELDVFFGEHCDKEILAESVATVGGVVDPTICEYAVLLTRR